MLWGPLLRRNQAGWVGPQRAGPRRCVRFKQIRAPTQCQNAISGPGAASESCTRQGVLGEQTSTKTLAGQVHAKGILGVRRKLWRVRSNPATLQRLHIHSHVKIRSTVPRKTYSHVVVPIPWRYGDKHSVPIDNIAPGARSSNLSAQLCRSRKRTKRNRISASSCFCSEDKPSANCNLLTSP